MIWPEVH